MSKTILEFDSDRTTLTGILNVREEEDDYSLELGEVTLPDDVDERALHRYLIDPTTDPPSVIENPDWTPEPTTNSLDKRIDTIQSNKPVTIPDNLKQQYRDATTNQSRADILFEMLTGEEP